ncbi:mycothiol system anti-sigma-R factor [Rhodococcus spongiicola]|uniref:Mycothiol system anti-sigma-R factor n=1 Tax=Rhodococcus spongiicola TaxID=2487352 RepID=A0A438B0W2_9NOCA|nr:mycothiol system anti-sigma-R factor [Rhodococcus spongiicola]RVW04600.1 mycothiol system anti-sigma-R factor [Rhodococcus spongiicola]
MTGQNEFEQLDCSAVIADVWLLLDHECDERARARLQHHLDTCRACFEVYGIEEKVKSLISRKCGGERAPEGLRERLSIEIRRTVILTESDLVADGESED